MKILILGGHGFLGKNVVEVFQNSGYEALPISRRDSLDLTNFDATKEYFGKLRPEAIINCAAMVGSLNYVTEEAADVFDCNMRMLVNIYKAALKTSAETVMINPIANCAFPGDLETYTEDSLWKGKIHQSVLAYGNTRRMMAILSECYEMQYGFRSLNFFVPNMYGPHDSTDPNKAHALNALIGKTIKGKRENWDKIEVWGSGIAVREWLYVKDCAAVFLEAVKRLDEYGFPEPINIAKNSGLSIRELVSIIVDEIGFVGKVVWDRKMPDGAPRKVMDDRRFRKVFPHFEFTDFRKGIRKTIEYYDSIFPY